MIRLCKIKIQSHKSAAFNRGVRECLKSVATLSFAFSTSLSAFAQNTIAVASSFQSAAGLRIADCNAASLATPLSCVNPLPAPGGAAASVRMVWTDASIADWAGTILRARVDISGPDEGTISGAIHFTYGAENGLAAVALKQTSGGQDLIVKGAIDDFTDAEGRRIFSLAPGRALDIDVPIAQRYAGRGRRQTVDILVELEPVEYLPSHR